MKPATNKELELVGSDKLKEIDNEFDIAKLKEIAFNALKQRHEHKNSLDNDEAIQSLQEDIKALKDAYNDIIKGCKIIESRICDRIKELELE